MRIPNWLFAVILSIVPIGILALEFSPRYGFLVAPRFGEVFRASALETVKRYAPPARPNDVGYDGQFYAQIALDPTLREPGLRTACDNLSYRAKRIALPTIAFLLGGGHPWLVLQIYSVLNLIFWFLLLTLLVRCFGMESESSRMLLIAILWNAGGLISIGRALTDLPALCFGIAAICFFENRTQDATSRLSRSMGSSPWLFASLCMSLAALTKETSLLSLLLFDCDSLKRRWRQWIAIVLIVILPIGIWSVYVHHQVGKDTTGLGNFALPLFGFSHKVVMTFREAFANFPRMPLLELIAPWCIVVQIYFMFRYASLQSRWWRFGIGFAILAIMIGPYVWATQSAYSRCLLPLTVSFNVMLWRAHFDVKRHWQWWMLGNIGFLDRAIPGLAILGLVHFLWVRNRLGNDIADGPEGSRETEAQLKTDDRIPHDSVDVAMRLSVKNHLLARLGCLENSAKENR